MLKYSQTKKLQYLNTFLKLNDTICSQISQLNNDECVIFANILEEELLFIHDLCKMKGIEI